MPGPKNLQKEQQINQEPLFVHQVEEEWEIINPSVNMQELAQDLNNMLAPKAVEELPLHTFKNVEALNAYIREREGKSYASNYEEYRQLAEKLTLSANKQGNKTKQSDWERLEKEAEAVLEKVRAEDVAQQKIRENANFFALEEAIDALLADRNRVTDSTFYKDLRKAAKAYKKETDFGKKIPLMKELKKQALAYAALRFKTTHKTKKGTRRMERVTGILSMIDKLGEVGDLICIIREQVDKTVKIGEELTENHLPDINETKSKLNKMAPRFAQGMLPYEVGSDGKVTPETAANYEENMELIEAYKSNDKKRRKHVILKMYKRLSLSDCGNEPITIENALKIYMQLYKGKGLQTNLNIVSDLVSTEYDKTGKNPDPELKYIYDRTRDSVRQSMNNIAVNYLNSLGIDEYGRLMKKDGFNPKNYKEAVKILLDQAKTDLEKNGKNQIVTYVPKDEEMEKQVQDTIDKYENSKEYRENCVPDSKEYMDKTVKMMQESADKQNKLQDIYLKERYKKECYDHTYWKQSERFAQLMMEEETDEKNKLTETGQKNYEYNEKMMKLFNSPNPEDRTAALASCYLRKYRGTLGKLELNEKGLNRFIRKQLDLKGFFGMYNTLDDYVLAEFERNPENKLVAYMYKNLLSIRVTKPSRLEGFYFNSKDYDDIDHKKRDNVMIEVSKNIVAEEFKNAFREYDEEKAKNDNKYITEDKNMIAELKKLCKEKGVLI